MSHTCGHVSVLLSAEGRKGKILTDKAQVMHVHKVTSIAQIPAKNRFLCVKYIYAQIKYSQ